MKNLILTSLFISIINSVTAQEQEKKYNLLFIPGQTQLTPKQKKEINDIASSINDCQKVILYPLTYDSIYDRLTYAKNAKDQASEIATYAKTVGFELLGNPMNFPSTYRGYSVSVILKYNKPNDTITSVIDDEILSYGLRKHYPEKSSQFFIVDPNEDTLIVGNEGTKLFFSAGSLKSKKKVKIELKEFYSLDDYMKGGIPTVSNGKMIQTGGAIYLNATQNDSGNQQVNIDPDKGVEIDFKLGKDDPEMQIFIKDQKSKKMNWILPSKNKMKEDWEMTETIKDADGVITKKKYTSKEEWEKHLKEEERLEKEKKEKERIAKEEAILQDKKAKEEAIKQEKIAAKRRAIQDKMDSKFTVYNLGYINCDKFLNEPMIQFIIAGDEKINAEYYLLYKDVRGVMTGYVNNKKVSFGSVPKNRQATLIAVSFFEKQAYYFECTIIIGTKTTPKISLKPVDEIFIDKQLALLK